MASIDFPGHPPESLDAVISRLGPWPVLRAALAALLRPRPRRQPAGSLDPLNDRLLRDIGLAPRGRSQPSRIRLY